MSAGIKEEKLIQTVAKPNVALVWAQYGPYHFARLRAMQQRNPDFNVVGVEIGAKTSIYDWKRGTGATGLFTLFPGANAEAVPPLQVYARARKLFRAQQVTVVMVPSYWPSGAMAITAAARSIGACTVMMNESHAHTAKARGVRAWIKRQLVRQFDAALVGGTPHQEYFASLGLEARKIFLGYDAVDNTFFMEKAAAARTNLDTIRAKHGLPERYFLSLGRFVEKKNLVTLIDAYKLVKDKLGESCPALVMVGSGECERALYERCLERSLRISSPRTDDPNADGARGDVYFFGFKQIDEIPEFYALWDPLESTCRHASLSIL